MKRIIRFFAVVLALMTVAAVSCTPASALNFDCDVEQFSDSLLMVNLDTGMEVFVKAADTKR